MKITVAGLTPQTFEQSALEFVIGQAAQGAVAAFAASELAGYPLETPPIADL